MGLGVLQDPKLDHVPGTTQYFEEHHHHVATAHARELKYDTRGREPVLLVPQPSDDPNDPLNWPLWQRDLITLCLSLGAVFGTALGPILAPNTFTLSLWFVRPFAKIAELTGWFLLGCGIGAVVFVPSSRIWGKRHAFLLGIVFLVFSSAWGGASGRNYDSFVWARIVQGVGCAPYESLLNAAIGDLYFVHERGLRMAFTNLAVFGSAFFSPILVGKITHTIKWWWTFWLVAIFCAACLPAIYFLCPETAYPRPKSFDLDLHASDDPSSSPDTAAAQRPSESSETEANAQADPEKAVRESAPTTTTTTTTTPCKKTYRESLAVFTGRKTDDNFLKLFLRPFVLFLQPAFLWASLVQGTLIGWTVFIGVVMTEFLFGSPLWWNEVQTGYAYTGAFLGAVGGFALAGLLADPSRRLLTRWNGGVYEPEFRLVLVAPQLALSCAGLFGFGISADGLLRGDNGVAVPLAMFGLTTAAMVVGAVASSLYVVDAYRDQAVEAFTCTIIFKNLFSFALTFKAFDWLVSTGTHARPLFNVLGTVQIVVCLSTVPMYIFGKRVRGFFHRHDLLSWFGVR